MANMKWTVIFINLFALICFFISYSKDRGKSKLALKVSLKSFLRILPLIFIIVILIGLMLAFLSPDKISKIAGQQSGYKGVLIFAFLGTILHIPSLVSFPLAASLLRSGASLTAIAAFITTLTMIGIVTLPLEIKELGKKIALLRNGLSFIAALAIALIIGAVL